TEENSCPLNQDPHSKLDNSMEQKCDTRDPLQKTGQDSAYYAASKDWAKSEGEKHHQPSKLWH
ncbi:hypothetical protein A2U01_0109964, partial [Trifolium medium]|nr:hypothetical protein [Trifolium medium]